MSLLFTEHQQINNSRISTNLTWHIDINTQTFRIDKCDLYRLIHTRTSKYERTVSPCEDNSDIAEDGTSPCSWRGAGDMLNY